MKEYKYDDLLEYYEKIEENFAKDKCCPNYEYYTITKTVGFFVITKMMEIISARLRRNRWR